MRSRLLLALIPLFSCGSVHDLDLAAAPYATLHAHLDLPAYTARAGGHSLLVALVWGRVPTRHSVCWEHPEDAVVQQACPDALGFFPEVVDVLVTVDPAKGGDVDLPLDHLPPASALVGTATDAVGYASLVVAADANDNGALDFFGVGETHPAVGHDPPPSFPGPPGLPTPDWILGATFSTLRAPQVRIAFRQGDFGALTHFYPAPACGTPPAGWSVLHAENATCTTADLTETLEIPPLPDADADAFACRNLRRADLTWQPDRQVGPDTHCINHDLAVVGVAGACPRFDVVSLAACRDDPSCARPEWDLRANPPEGWACGN